MGEIREESMECRREENGNEVVAEGGENIKSSLS